MANVGQLHIAADAGARMQLVDAVTAIASVGLDGDRYARGRGYYTVRA